MPLPLRREDIEHLSEELESIIAAHLGWFKRVQRQLVCGGEPGAPEWRDLLAQDGERRTPLGQWYYREEPHPLGDYPGFHELGAMLPRMHAAARTALREVQEGRRPDAQAYEACIDLALRVNTLLRHLQLELIGELLATDALTGCYTRRGMLARLRAEQERARRIQRPCSLCLMDFDRFKKINDELGHPAGDAVLRQGMRFALGMLRKYDSVYRYGGEEFLICLPGTPLKDAVAVIERLRRGLEALTITLPSGATYHATASFGVAELHPEQAVEDAIEAADQALIRAKEQGRNRVEIAPPLSALRHGQRLSG